MRKGKSAVVVLSTLAVACTSLSVGDQADRSNEASPEPTVVNPPRGGGPPRPAPGPRPDFGVTRQLANAPPPISGGTLAMLSDGRVAAADPDRDNVYIVDLTTSHVATIALSPHDEPGRVVEDDAGRVHVVLRGGRGVATIDASAETLLARRETCVAPRGIAFDGQKLLVACEGGEIVSLPADPSGAPALLARIDRDLRDIVVGKNAIYVSRFRTAEVLEIASDGTVLARGRQMTKGSEATLAWRMIAAPPNDPSDRPVVLHQMSTREMVKPVQGGYGQQAPATPGQCGQIVSAVIGRGTPLGPLVPAPSQSALVVDVALDDTEYALIAAGNGHTRALAQLLVQKNDSTSCDGLRAYKVDGQATAVAVRGHQRYVVQSREPARLQLFPEGTSIELSSESREDTGHAIFHSNSAIGLACASCHGEGRDDGHVWSFDSMGERRTPSLLGTLAGSAPYHWKGDMKDISQLADEVLTGRMSGPLLLGDQKSALEGWLFSLQAPQPSAPLDATSVARGRTLFESQTVGCTRCHSGSHYTNNATVDVGTGGSFQVPSLVGVSARAPFLHDGCAATLLDRFGSCGGSRHGDTSKLSATDLDDLVNFLGTL
jgi:hypothetical protein